MREAVETYPTEPSPWTVEVNVVLRNGVETMPRRFGDERNPAVWKAIVVDMIEVPSPWTVEVNVGVERNPEVCRPNVVETRDAVDRKPAVWYPY
jgi:hypothetical protein